MKKVLLVVFGIAIMICGCTSANANAENKTEVYSYEGETIASEQGYGKVVEERNFEKASNIPVVSSETSWAYDVTNPAAVFNNTDFFLRVRITDIGETKYFVENTIMPSSTYCVEVIEVMGAYDKKIPQTMNIVSKGGIVSMRDYVSTMDEGTRKKTNVEKLSDDELDSKIMINDESYFELRLGNEYYILVKDLTEDAAYKGFYGMPEGGYNVFELVDGMYVNVLTKRVLEF